MLTTKVMTVYCIGCDHRDRRIDQRSIQPLALFLIQICRRCDLSQAAILLVAGTNGKPYYTSSNYHQYFGYWVHDYIVATRKKMWLKLSEALATVAKTFFILPPTLT